MKVQSANEKTGINSECRSKQSSVMFQLLKARAKAQQNGKNEEEIIEIDDEHREVDGGSTGEARGANEATGSGSGTEKPLGRIPDMFETNSGNSSDGEGGQQGIRRARDLVAARCFEVTRRSGRKSKFIHSVYRKKNRISDDGVLHLFANRAHNSLFKWAVGHGDHIHFVHDCTYSNGSCRCFAKYDGFEKSTRRIIQTQSLTEEDFVLIVKYQFAGGRKVYEVRVGNVDYTRLFNKLPSIRDVECETSFDWDARDVERCLSEGQVLWDNLERRSDIPTDDELGSGHDRDDSPTEPAKRSRRSTHQKTTQQKQQERLEEFILAIGKVPLHDFVTTNEFLNSNWRFHNDMSTLFKNAIKVVKFKFCNMALRDYKRYYETLTVLPYWDTSTRENFDKKYMSLKDSKKWLMKLLIYQNNESAAMLNVEKGIVNTEYNWQPNVWSYVKDLIALLDKSRHKKNTDVYISPPNAGKTLFMDLIRDYLINCGQMSNWNRNSNFPLQTCGYTRAIFWNEPNYEQSVERNLLKLLGGDSLNAAIKNQMDVNIEKTPVFVTSNNYPFPNAPEFEYRIQRYNWKSAPFLIYIKGKKFHPLTFQYLITECENYYKEDIINYNEKYTYLENDYLQQINLYDCLTEETSEEESTDDEGDEVIHSDKEQVSDSD